MSHDNGARTDEQPIAELGVIQDEHTLLDVAATLIAFLDIQPVNAATFLGDWLAEWAQLGESQSRTVAQIDQDVFWRQTLGFMARVEYFTTEQQARVVMQNLPKVIAKDRVLRCIAALAERLTNPESVELLEMTAGAFDHLTNSELQALLGNLAGPLRYNADPWAAKAVQG